MDRLVTKAEIDRLVSNQNALLQAIPEPVMVINGTHNIEFMNQSAQSFINSFGKTLGGNQGARLKFFQKFLAVIDQTYQSDPDKLLCHTNFEDREIEYMTAPFHGYKGDGLQWLILRDITTLKKHEATLSMFHSKIESQFLEKISNTKESKNSCDTFAEQLIKVKSQITHQSGDDKMIGSSKPMRDLQDMVTQVAKSSATILITGESGTGKELVANLIRETSNRNKNPFLKINCNTINDSLLASDLFGYERGAFTGAHSRTKGKFEVVNGGTIFLDEIGDISPRMQSALLRVLQNGEIIRVGGNTPINVNVRVVAATNKDLALAVNEGKFRLDLYYRLNIITLSIPPLRERKGDIEDLVSYFILKYRKAFKKDIQFIQRPVFDMLTDHTWPGNIRELENVIQRAVLMAKSKIITEQEIFFDLPAAAYSNNSHLLPEKLTPGTPLKSILAEVEKNIIIESLKRHRGQVSQAAKELGVGKTAFYDKLKIFNISSKEYR